jgi:hypothetical protein
LNTITVSPSSTITVSPSIVATRPVDSNDEPCEPRRSRSRRAGVGSRRDRPSVRLGSCGLNGAGPRSQEVSPARRHDTPQSFEGPPGVPPRSTTPRPEDDHTSGRWHLRFLTRPGAAQTAAIETAPAPLITVELDVVISRLHVFVQVSTGAFSPHDPHIVCERNIEVLIDPAVHELDL